MFGNCGINIECTEYIFKPKPGDLKAVKYSGMFALIIVRSVRKLIWSVEVVKLNI